jgi:hypothetical protein
MKRFAVATTLILATLPASAAQRGAPSNSLARALTAFVATDADGDGRITPAEARAVPIGPAEFSRTDEDHDGTWTRDEFVLYYRRRLITDGRQVGADLDAEIARIQALKRVRATEQTRHEKGNDASGPEDVQPVGVRLENALDDLEKRAVAGAATPEDFRRLRNLAILNGRSITGGQAGTTNPAVNVRVLQTLARLEKRTAAGADVRDDLVLLRAMVGPSPSPARVAVGDRQPGLREPERESVVPGSIASPLNPRERGRGVLGPADARRRAVDNRDGGTPEARESSRAAATQKPLPIPPKASGVDNATRNPPLPRPPRADEPKPAGSKP